MSNLFRQHMLSQRTEAQRDDLRERLLTDPDLFDQLREEENEWIDAHAAGRLSSDDAKLLLRHLAETGQTQRLATARALLSPRRKQWRYLPAALAAAAVFVIGVGFFFQSQHVRPTRSLEVAVALAPGTLRDAQAVQSVAHNPRQRTVLQLLFQDTTPSGACRVTIKTASGQTVQEATGVCGTEFHAYTIPPDLPAARYIVELGNTNGELYHTYIFDLTRSSRLN